jgi:hypothetical protein
MVTWRNSQTSFLDGKTEIAFEIEGAQNLTNKQLWYLINEAERYLNEHVTEAPTGKELREYDPHP